ncbi:hypothetical protein [Burkholderia sp. L27(2015)]|uniref:hypothetical protein n=1 Tax=Burkholderia sp. L27(2015) TaxID=1641858 RepID=UPI00349E6268
MNTMLFAESFDLRSAFDAIQDFWSPKVMAQVNDQCTGGTAGIGSSTLTASTRQKLCGNPLAAKRI